uniref:Putative ovule protein n=1 Tax=Solanum chacoense TaxID=4108 RepID=A0A0V0HMQ9_SOLCH
MHTKSLNLLMQGSIVHSKIQVVTHHYQRISSSLYLLQMQVQAQQRYSNALTKRMIPYSHTMVQSIKVPKSRSTLTVKNINTMHDFTHRFALIFQWIFLQLI